MKAKEISNFLEKLAPSALAYEGEEMGFIFGNETKDVAVIGVTWRPTIRVLKEAAKENVDLLITHEPLFQSKKSFVIEASLLKYPPNEEREKILNQNNILVYRYHSQWDDAKEGNNEVLAGIFNLKNIIKIPYGRIGDIEPCSLSKFIEIVKEKLGCDNLLITDNDSAKMIKKIAVVAGSGNSLTEIIEFVKQKGAEVLISGDVQDSRARFATELGLTLIDAGGYFTETPGMKHLTRLIQEKFPELKIVCLDPGKPWRVV